MKIKSTFLLMILFAAFSGFQSCSGDDSDETDDLSTGCANFEAEYEDVSEALTAYSQSQTTANCEAYKNALLDFYGDFNDCPYWGDYYQEAYDQIQQINCSEAGTD